MSDAARVEEYEGWVDLINHDPPDESIADRTMWPLSEEIQALEDGSGTVSVDRYEVQVDRMPDTDGGMTPEDLLLEMLNAPSEFLNWEGATFEPMTEADAERLRSGSALGAKIHIDFDTAGVNLDDGSVYVSEQTDQYFTFTTIWTREDGSHPVSGHRRFGFERNPDGSVTFYTMGVDRPTGVLEDHDFGQEIALREQYAQWVNFQVTLAQRVNAAGGLAKWKKPTRYYLDWDEVVDFLRSKGRYTQAERTKRVTARRTHAATMLDIALSREPRSTARYAWPYTAELDDGNTGSRERAEATRSSAAPNRGTDPGSPGRNHPTPRAVMAPPKPPEPLFGEHKTNHLLERERPFSVDLRRPSVGRNDRPDSIGGHRPGPDRSGSTLRSIHETSPPTRRERPGRSLFETLRNNESARPRTGMSGGSNRVAHVSRGPVTVTNYDSQGNEIGSTTF